MQDASEEPKGRSFALVAIPLRIAECDKEALDRLARARSSTVQKWDRSKLIREAIEIYLRDHGEKGGEDVQSET